MQHLGVDAGALTSYESWDFSSKNRDRIAKLLLNHEGRIEAFNGEIWLGYYLGAECIKPVKAHAIFCEATGHFCHWFWRLSATLFRSSELGCLLKHHLPRMNHSVRQLWLSEARNERARLCTCTFIDIHMFY